MALIHANFFSQAVGMERQIEVILPQVSNGVGQAGADETGMTDIPVLYLLHGGSDDHTIWQRRTSIERYATAKGLAVIMPSTDLGFYCDMKYGYDYFRYIGEELPKIVHEFFPALSVSREKTFVAGLSMGGFGAFKLGIHFPEKFSYAASLSGFLDPAEDLKAFAARPDRPESAFDWIYGSAEEVVGTIDDLPYQLDEQIRKKAKLPRFFMACGTEDFLYQTNLRFKNRFEGRIDLTWLEEPGTHEWGFWDRNIQRVLDWLPLEERRAR
ncbi:MAG: esterase family protein [Firmicutes bacterium]|nr:esterase family protein [Bacillota bacterium]